MTRCDNGGLTKTTVFQTVTVGYSDTRADGSLRTSVLEIPASENHLFSSFSTAGLDFEIPYRNRAAKAAREQAHVAITRMRHQFDSTVASVAEDVRQQVIERNKFGHILPQRDETLRSTQDLLKYTRERRRTLADGTSVAELYLGELLQIQERVRAAESGYLQAQVQYSLADNALLRAIARLDSIANQRTPAILQR